jgi:hypothetical protein
MRLLSVTQILSPFNDFSQVPPDRLTAAAARGTAVHQACAAHARSLPVFETSGSLYFKSFKNWFDKYVLRALFVEAEFSDQTCYGIIGHVDLVAELVDGRIVVVDYKTPVAESPCWKSQISAYCYLCKTVVGEVEGLALQLSPEGNAARAIHYKNTASAFAAFLAALSAYRYFKESA